MFDPDSFLSEAPVVSAAPEAFDPDAFLGDVASTQTAEPVHSSVAPEDDSWDITRGFKTSIKQLVPLAQGVAGLIGSTAENTIGVGQDLRDWGLHGYTEGMEKLAPLARENDEITKAWGKVTKDGDIGALADWAQYQMGYVLGQAAETIGVAVIGGAAGAAAGAETGPGAAVTGGAGAVAGAVAKGTVKKVAGEMIEKLVASQAMKIAAKQAEKIGVKTGVEMTAEEIAAHAATDLVRKAATKRIGATIATIGNATAMELGSIYPEAEKQAKSEGKELSGSGLAKVWGTGLVAGGLESVGDVLGLDLVTGGLNSTIRKVLPGVGKLATIGAVGAVGGAEEFLTEYSQTFLERLGAGQSIDSQEAKDDYINSAFAGLFGGATMGGAGAAISADPAKESLRAVGLTQTADALPPMVQGAPLMTPVAPTPTTAIQPIEEAATAVPAPGVIPVSGVNIPVGNTTPQGLAEAVFGAPKKGLEYAPDLKAEDFALAKMKNSSLLAVTHEGKLTNRAYNPVTGEFVAAPEQQMDLITKHQAGTARVGEVLQRPPEILSPNEIDGQKESKASSQANAEGQKQGQVLTSPDASSAPKAVEAAAIPTPKPNEQNPKGQSGSEVPAPASVQVSSVPVGEAAQPNSQPAEGVQENAPVAKTEAQAPLSGASTQTRMREQAVSLAAEKGVSGENIYKQLDQSKPTIARAVAEIRKANPEATDEQVGLMVAADAIHDEGPARMAIATLRDQEGVHKLAEALQSSPVDESVGTDAQDRASLFREDLGLASPSSQPITPTNTTGSVGVTRSQAREAFQSNKAGRVSFESGPHSPHKTALLVNTLVTVNEDEGTTNAGMTTEAFRVTATEPLENGGVRHILSRVPITEKGLESGIAAYAPNQQMMKDGASLLASMRELISVGGLSNNKAARVAERALRVVIRRQFAAIADEKWAGGENIRFTALNDGTNVLRGSSMQTVWESGEPAPHIIVDSRQWLESMLESVQSVDVANTAALDYMARDFVEKLAQTSYEEFNHYIGVQAISQQEMGDVMEEVVASDNPATREAFLLQARRRSMAHGNEVPTDADLMAVFGPESSLTPEQRRGELTAIGYEMMASLNQLLTTGSDSTTIHNDALRWAQQIAPGDSKANTLFKRLLDMANRYMAAISRFLNAHAALGQLPPRMQEFQQRIDRVMKEGGFKAPDTLNVVAGFARRANDVMAHASKSAQEGWQFASTQKELREAVTRMRLQHGEQFNPLTLDVVTGAIKLTGVMPEEEAVLKPLLDRLNTAGRMDVAVRTAAMRRDYDLVLTQLNSGRPVSAKSKVVDTFDVARMDEYDAAIRRDTRNAVVKASGIPEQSLITRVNNAMAERLSSLSQTIGSRESLVALLDSERGRSIKGMTAALLNLRDASNQLQHIANTRLMGEAALLNQWEGRDETLEFYLDPANVPTLANEDNLLTQNLAFSGAIETHRAKVQAAYLATHPKATDQEVSEATEGDIQTLISKGFFGVPFRGVQQTSQAQQAYEAYYGGLEENKEGLEAYKTKREAMLSRGREAIASREAAFQQAMNGENGWIAARGRLMELVNRESAKRSNPEEDVFPAQIRNLLADNERSLRATLDAARDGVSRLRPVRSVADLVSRYSEHPEMVGGILRSTDLPTDAVEMELEKASALQQASARMHSFSSELGYLVMGGRQPESMRLRQRKWVSHARLEATMMPLSNGPIILPVAHPLEDVRDRVNVAPMNFSATLSIPTEFGTVSFAANPSQAIPWQKGPDGFAVAAAPGAVSSEHYSTIISHLAAEVGQGSVAASRVLGVEPLVKPVHPNGETFTSSDVTNHMSANARIITEQLVPALQDAFWRNSSGLLPEHLSTNGFSIPLTFSEDGTVGTLIMPQNLLDLGDTNRVNFDLEWDAAAEHLATTGFMGDVLLELGSFVSRMGTNSTLATIPRLSHENGLTAGGFAYQVLSPKVLEFLALTKDLQTKFGNFSELVAKHSTRPEQVGALYAQLAAGFENAPHWKTQRDLLASNPGNISSLFWEMRRHGKIADGIYSNATRLSKDSSYSREQVAAMTAGLPVDVAQLQSSAFNVRIRAYSAGAVESTGKYISLVTPVRAQRFISQYNALSAEANILPNRDTDRGAVEDFELSDQQREMELKNEEGAAARMDKWRGEALMALLGGDIDAVLQFVNDPQFTSTATVGGIPTTAYHRELIDQAILSKLDELHEEEMVRGVVIDSNRRNREVYDGALRDVLARASEEHKPTLESLLYSGGTLERWGSPDVQLQPEQFEASTLSVMQAVASLVPNLSVVNGNASWEGSRDDVKPPVSFIGDSIHPLLAMPYGGRVEIGNHEAREALESMFKWLAEHGKVDVQNEAFRIMEAMAFKPAFSPDIANHVRSRLSEDFKLSGKDITEVDDMNIAAISSMWQNVVETGANMALERLRDAGEVFFNPREAALMVASAQIPTVEQSARILSLALTHPDARKALVLSMTQEPEGPAPTQAQMAARGDLMGVGHLPGHADVIVSNEMEKASEFWTRPDIGEGGFEEQAHLQALKLAETVAIELNIEKDENAMTSLAKAGVSPIVQLQGEWAGKLLNSILTNLEGASASTQPISGVVPEQKLTQMEARQLLAVTRDEELQKAVSRSQLIWNGTSAERPSAASLMQVAGTAADALRAEYNEIVPFDPTVDYSEDQALNYKTFSFGNSLEWDGRQSPWKASRIAKGMIREGELDGGVFVPSPDKEGKGVLYVDASNPQKLNALHADTNRTMWVGEGENKRSVVDDVIARYWQDVADEKEVLGGFTAMAALSGQRIVMARSILADLGTAGEPGGLRNQLLGASDAASYLRMLEQASPLDISSGAMGNLDQLVKQTYSDREQLVGAMAQEIERSYQGNLLDASSVSMRSMVRAKSTSSAFNQRDKRGIAPETPFQAALSAFRSTMSKKGPSAEKQALLAQIGTIRRTASDARIKANQRAITHPEEAQAMQMLVISIEQAEEREAAAVFEQLRELETSEMASYRDIAAKAAPAVARSLNPSVVGLSTVERDMQNLHEETIPSVRERIGRMDSVLESLRLLAETDNQNGSARMDVLNNQLTRLISEHNGEVRDAARFANQRIPNVMDPAPFLIDERNPLPVMRHFMRQLSLMANPQTLHELGKVAAAETALKEAEWFDPSGGVSSLEHSQITSDRRVEIPMAAREQIRSILTDGKANVRQRIEMALLEHVLPMDAAALSATTALEKRMADMLSEARRGSGDTIMSAFRAASTVEELERLDSLTRNRIVTDTIRSVVEGGIQQDTLAMERALRDRAKAEAKYAHRNAMVFAPRPGQASLMVYKGSPDDVAITRRIHAAMAERWSRNAMESAKKGQWLDGMRNALEAAKTADELSMLGADAMTAATGQDWEVDADGNVVRSAIRLAAAAHPPIVAHQANAPVVGALMKTLEPILFKPGITTLSSQLAHFDNIESQRQDVTTMLQLMEVARNQPTFATVGTAAGTQPSLAKRIDELLSSLQRAPEANLARIQPLYNELMAEAQADSGIDSILDGFVQGELFSKPVIKGLLNDDPTMRLLFSKNVEGFHAAGDIRSVIESGPTGVSGREGSTAQSHAMSKILSEGMARVTGSNRFEKMSEGVAFQQHSGYLMQSPDKIQDRADNLIRMYQQADDGYLSALTQNNPPLIAGNTMQEVMNFGIGKLRDVKQWLTGESYQMLEERLVYEKQKAKWMPLLQRISSGTMHAGDVQYELAQMEKALHPEARDWGKLVHDVMFHASRSLITQAKLSGIDTKWMEQRSIVPFRWQVYNREFNLNEETPKLGDQLGMERAMWMQPVNRNVRRGEMHILSVNGSEGPIQIINDMLYRVNVAPAHAAFVATVGESEHVGKTLQASVKGRLEEMSEERFGTKADIGISASRAIALTGQELLNKDMSSIAPKHRLMDIIHQFQQQGAVRALISAKQIWSQTIPGMVMYSGIRDGVGANRGFPSDYFQYLFGKIGIGRIAQAMGGTGTLARTRDYATNVDNFVLRWMPNAYKRTADGQQLYFDEASRIRPSKENRPPGTVTGNFRKTGDLVTRPLAKAHQLTSTASNWMLHTVLAKPESTLVRSIAVDSLLRQVNEEQVRMGGMPITKEMLVDPRMNWNITPDKLYRATLAVTDIMSPTDGAKKAAIFQQSGNTLAETMRGLLVTFANHQLHTSGNSYAAAAMIRNGDAKTRAEGIRIMSTNAGQNIMFQLFRYETMGLLIIGLIGALAGWDEDEKEEAYGRLYGIVPGETEDQRRGRIMRWVSLLGGGSANPIGYNDKTGEWDEGEKAKDTKQFGLMASKEVVAQLPFGGVGMMASTAIGSTMSEYLLKNTVMHLLPGELSYYERAGIVIPERWGGTGEGPQSESAFERSLYATSQVFLNDIASRSTLTGGITSLVDPLSQISNAPEEVGAVDTASIWMSSFPALPREMRKVAQKSFLENTDAQIWSGSWEAR